ncbi:hypothetical protein FKM82_029281 [Ascaphus truei]
MSQWPPPCPPPLADVDGKVIHLVERAPPQAQPPPGGPSASSSSTPSPPGGAVGGPGTGGPERNGNSYVMVGTFNLPHVMSGLGEAGRGARVTTAGGVSIGEQDTGTQHVPTSSPH